MNLANSLILSCLLFSVGVVGLLTRRHIIGALISIELMLNAVLINFIAFSYFKASDPTAGSVFAVFTIALTSAEMAVALAIVVAMYRQHKNLDLEKLDSLHG